jgi:hypothetical protein
MNKKIAVGMVTVALFWLIGNELIGLLELPIPPGPQSFVISLTGSGIGAYIAKRNFIIPAFAVWFLCWCFAIYMLYLIAEPTGQASISSIIEYNILALAISAIASFIGALGGQVLAQRNQGMAAAT